MKRDEFTLIELLVVIAIIAILASILLPSLGKARDKAYSMTCMSNLKQMGYCFNLYLSDSNDWYPNWRWNSGLDPYINPNGKTYVKTGKCPKTPAMNEEGVFTLESSYSFTGVYYADTQFFSIYQNLDFKVKGAEVRRVSEKIVVNENYGTTGHRYWGSNDLNDRSSRLMHGRNANFLFADGHSESIFMNFGTFSSGPVQGAYQWGSAPYCYAYMPKSDNTWR